MSDLFAILRVLSILRVIREMGEALIGHPVALFLVKSAFFGFTGEVPVAALSLPFGLVAAWVPFFLVHLSDWMEPIVPPPAPSPTVSRPPSRRPSAPLRGESRKEQQKAKAKAKAARKARRRNRR